MHPCLTPGPAPVAERVGGIVPEVTTFPAFSAWGREDHLVTEVALPTVGELTGPSAARELPRTRAARNVCRHDDGHETMVVIAL